MKILITGALGYIGSAFINKVKDDPAFSDYKFILYDNLQEENHRSLFGISGSDRFIFKEESVLDIRALKEAVSGCDVVIHLAAVVNAPQSFDRPELTREVNINGTRNVLKASIQNDVGRIIFTSTAGIYGKTNSPVNEKHPPDPQSPYAESKLRAENLLLEASKKEDIEAAIIRFGTVYGAAPAVRFHTVLNKFIYMACFGQPLTVYGEGKQKRPFIHIKDTADILKEFIRSEDLKYSIYNVFTENLSIIKIAGEIQKILPETELVYLNREILNQISYELNKDRLTQLGIKPDIEYRRGIKNFISVFEKGIK